MTTETQPEPTALQLEEAISICLASGLKIENLGPVPNPQRELGRIAASFRAWWEEHEPRLDMISDALTAKLKSVRPAEQDAMAEGVIAYTLDYWLWTKVEEMADAHVALLDAYDKAKCKTQADLDDEWAAAQ